MELQVIELAGTVVIRLEGDLDVYSSTDLISRFTVLIKEGKTDLAIDLGGIAFIDSSGVGALVQASQMLRRHSRKLILANPSELVLRVLMAMSLTGIFEIREQANLEYAPTPVEGPEWRKSRRILIVADIPQVLQSTHDILQAEGYGVVIGAGDHIEALRQATRHMVHLIVVDLSHDLVSATHLLDALRADGKEMPVCMTSAGRWHGGTRSHGGAFVIDESSRRRFLTLVNSALTGEELGLRDQLRAQLGL